MAQTKRKKLEQQLLIEKRWSPEQVATLTAAKKRHVETRFRYRKRATLEELKAYLHPRVREALPIRPESEFQSTSHSRAKQVRALLDHLYVRYPVPEFLYASALTARGRELVLDFDWAEARRRVPGSIERLGADLFLAAGAGRSISPLLKDRLTKKEIFEFTKTPNGYNLTAAMVFAKVRTRVPILANKIALMKLLRDNEIFKLLGDQVDDLIHLYSGRQVSDYEHRAHRYFLVHALRFPTFRLKDHSLDSLLAAARQFREQNNWGTLEEVRSWKQTFQVWERDYATFWVRAVELTNSKELHKESAVQRHCVFTYNEDCLASKSKIVCVRWFALDGVRQGELARLTIEVDLSRKLVVQIRGRFNEDPTKEQMHVVRAWCMDMGLKVCPDAF